LPIWDDRNGPKAVGLLSGERPEEPVYQRTCVEWQGLTPSRHLVVRI
jgi:hypothetical protein